MCKNERKRKFSSLSVFAFLKQNFAFRLSRHLYFPPSFGCIEPRVYHSNGRRAKPTNQRARVPALFVYWSFYITNIMPRIVIFFFRSFIFIPFSPVCLPGSSREARGLVKGREKLWDSRGVRCTLEVSIQTIISLVYFRLVLAFTYL